MKRWMLILIFFPTIIISQSIKTDMNGGALSIYNQPNSQSQIIYSLQAEERRSEYQGPCLEYQNQWETKWLKINYYVKGLAPLDTLESNPIHLASGGYPITTDTITGWVHSDSVKTDNFKSSILLPITHQQIWDNLDPGCSYWVTNIDGTILMDDTFNKTFVNLSGSVVFLMRSDSSDIYGNYYYYNTENDIRISIIEFNIDYCNSGFRDSVGNRGFIIINYKNLTEKILIKSFSGC